MIDVDLESVSIIPGSRLNMIEIQNVTKIEFENRKLKFLVVIFTITIIAYCVKIGVEELQKKSTAKT